MHLSEPVLPLVKDELDLLATLVPLDGQDIDDGQLTEARAALAPHCGPDGTHFLRPMHVQRRQRLA